MLVEFSRWFAIQVVPRYEIKASILLGFKGYQCYVPMHMARRKWSDRIKTLKLPLFPGYIFCRFQDVPTGRIVDTPRVIRIVSFGGKPSTVGDDEIEAVHRVADKGTNPQPWPYLRVGQRVQISSGPLAGIAGILTRIKNHHRLVISLEAVMKSISVEIGSSDIYHTIHSEQENVMHTPCADSLPISLTMAA